MSTGPNSRIEVVLAMPSAEVLEGIGSIGIKKHFGNRSYKEHLSEEESAVLYLASYGGTVHEVAAVMDRDTAQVGIRRDEVVSKFGVPNMAAAVYQAFRQDVLDYENRQVSGSLTERDLYLLSLLSEGLTNAEIGNRIYKSKASVVNLHRKLFKKLDATGKTHAMRRSYESGIFTK